MNDHIRFHCSNCGKRLKAPLAHTGKRARCSCGQGVVVPSPEPRSLDDDDLPVAPPRTSSRSLWLGLAGGVAALSLLAVVLFMVVRSDKAQTPPNKDEIAAVTLPLPTPETKPEPKPDPKQEAKPEPKPAPKQEAIPKPAPKSETQAAPDPELLGSWELVEGSEPDVRHVRNWMASGFQRLTIERERASISFGDYLHYNSPKNRTEHAIVIDAAKQPKVITLTALTGPEAKKTRAGIYRIDGGSTLLLCSYDQGAPPSDFDIKPGQDLNRKKTLARYVRMNTDYKAALADIVGEWKGGNEMMRGNTLTISKNGEFEAGLGLPVGDSGVQEFVRVRSRVSETDGVLLLKFTVRVRGAFGAVTSEFVELRVRLSADKRTLFLADDRLSLNAGWNFVLVAQGTK